jgi:hypothetical protein
MRKALLLTALAALPAAGGCGNGSPPLNTAPLTEEERRQIREADQRIDDAEKSGSGTAVAGPKKRK